MRRACFLLCLLAGPLHEFCSCSTRAGADEAPKPLLVVKPDAFPTLVNPKCSHCRDEARRRAKELRDDDRVLCWIRGYSDGGAIPYRFFLERYRVISDTYGVFVHDPDAGFARGFAASLDFTFHGWRNGVMVMKHKDGTLYSCLSGVAFDGPGKGKRLTPVPTLVSDWGFWLKRYPHAVAYHMFDKYKPVERAASTHPKSLETRLPGDKRLPAETAILGVFDGKKARAYPIDVIAKAGLILDRVDGSDRVILWQPATKTAAAYLPVASPPKKEGGKPRNLTLKVDRKGPDAPFVDSETGSRWDIAGRAVAGELKGWTLTWLDGTQLKWFAWSAEYPTTSLYAAADKRSAADKAIREVAGSAEYLRAMPKKFATLSAVDASRRRVTLLAEGDKTERVWPLVEDAEIKVDGWWGRLDQLSLGQRVWVWLKTDRKNKPVAIAMLADALSEQDIHGIGVTVVKNTAGVLVVKPEKGPERTLKTAGAKCYQGKLEVMADKFAAGARVFVRGKGDSAVLICDPPAFEERRQAQRRELRKLWLKEGLPGSVSFVHVFSGELDLLLDHESMHWGRSLKLGDKVKLAADPDIAAVVKSVTPWRERTLLRLVARSRELADLKPGQRLTLKMPAPPPEVESSTLPPDLDRPRSRAERIDWFLASIYCTCGIRGDGCTGHFYTLASCNPNGCGKPNQMRKRLGELIDQGLSDRQIFQKLLAEEGPGLLQPHLLP